MKGEEIASTRKERDLDAEIYEFWDIVEEELEKLKLDYAKVRVYQDSYYGHVQPFKKCAKRGSRNAAVFLKLAQQGATIEATEEESLPRISAIMDFFYSGSGDKRFLEKGEKLLIERDQFVAKRIAETLKDGETGILMMGASHNVDYYLPKDIKVYSLPKSDAFMANLLQKIFPK